MAGARDAVAAVLEDEALSVALFRHMLQPLLLGHLGAVASACQRLRATVEQAARSLTLQASGKAFQLAGEPWAAHWALVAAALQIGAGGPRLIADALYGDPVGGEVPAPTPAAVVEAERLVAALVGAAEGAAEGSRRLLGRGGPASLLPLQRRLLERLCLEGGALRGAPALARLTAAKAMGTALEADACLDLAEVLNLRAYARTYVSRRPSHQAELVEAVDAARRAVARMPVGAAWAAKGFRLQGRTLASAAHAQQLGALQGGLADVLLEGAGGDGERVFHAALRGLSRSVEVAGQHLREVQSQDTDRLMAAQRELGASLASLGECWYCVASAAGAAASGPDLLAERAPQRARDVLEEALRTLGEAPSLERADALKDYGKVLTCFDFPDRPDAGPHLAASLELHLRLLGPGHPRTRNVRRLMRS